MTKRRPGRLCRPLVAAVLSLSLAGAAAEADDSGDACLDDLRDPEAVTIACELPFSLPDDERRVMRTLTAGLLKDASCVATIDMAREVLVRALMRDDLLHLPPQPVSCAIATDTEPITAHFTLSPKVWLADGRAVRASPGMDDLVGLPGLIAGLVTDWVNESGAIEDAMVEAVNDYIGNGLPE